MFSSIILIVKVFEETTRAFTLVFFNEEKQTPKKKEEKSKRRNWLRYCWSGTQTTQQNLFMYISLSNLLLTCHLENFSLCRPKLVLYWKLYPITANFVLAYCHHHHLFSFPLYRNAFHHLTKQHLEKKKTNNSSNNIMTMNNNNNNKNNSYTGLSTDDDDVGVGVCGGSVLFLVISISISTMYSVRLEILFATIFVFWNHKTNTTHYTLRPHNRQNRKSILFSFVLCPSNTAKKPTKIKAM